jgi:hypothetical protein
MVIIDSYNAKFGRMIMCHMMADTHEELLEMADKIGVQRQWLQYPGSCKEHFDICLAKKKIAIEKFGAKEVGNKEIVELMKKKGNVGLFDH